jgi:hypothetical protein
MDVKQSMMEQAGFLLSMQDRAYTDKIKQVGQLRNLQSKVNFTNEMQDVIFGNSIDLIKTKLGQSDILDASRRDYNIALNKITTDEAIQIADAEAQHRQAQFDVAVDKAKYGYTTEATMGRIDSQGQATSGSISGAIGAYGAYQAQQDREAAQERQAQVDKADAEYKQSILDVLSRK